MKDTTKIALTTGASRGLGKNTALALAKKGVGVIVTYRSSEAEAKTVISVIEELGIKAVALQLDTANTNTFDTFVLQVKRSLQDLGRSSSLISWSIMVVLVSVLLLQKRLKKSLIDCSTLRSRAFSS